ncbi:hypothetical protein B566_EDAN018749 [Ephemera danica]|nr:hypothetical protein B566_EDAN018749 [Ephemera danica]
MTDYKTTLHLPQTDFPMKANLARREPETLKHWEATSAYQAMVSSGGEKGTFVLHDGPPYANGNIHIGTALNKILKDIIVKSRNMQGYKAEYVPGWDCHGLPIELKVEHSLGEKKKDLPAHVVRRLCREYAAKWIKIQREEFKRLGVMGTWEAPYLSMDPAYEAATARELGNFMAAGSVARSKKPIHWCCSCRTALAEAEVEYADHTSPSIYVRFPVVDPRLTTMLPKANPGKTWLVIWTTTPWTIPDNTAIALHPDLEYALVGVGDECYILAEGLLETCRKAFGWEDATVLALFKAGSIEGMQARHPLYDRPSPVVLGNHVTLEAGTGCVHTAPGHGREDYDMGLKYGLDILSPLDDSGRFLPAEPLFAGHTVFEANPLVIEALSQAGALLAQGKECTMKRTVLFVPLTCLLLVLGGCIGGGGSTTRGTQSGESLNDKVTRHDQQIQGLLAQVGQVEQVLPGQAEMWSQMQTIRQDLNGVMGRTEELQAQSTGEGTGELARLRDKVSRLEGVVRQMASQLAISTEGLEGGPEPASAPSGASNTPRVITPGASVQPGATATPAVDTATSLYEAGVKSFDQGKHKEAIISFQDFTKSFPKHKLAGNAQFWMGESYYQMKEYPRAALAYQDVITKYPGSAKFQAAMLKQGMALSSAGKKEAGRERLQELVKRYPNSPEATRAKQLLFSPTNSGQPVMCHLVRQYDITYNIVAAQTTSGKEGFLILEVWGAEKNCLAALEYLREQGIQVATVKQHVSRNEDGCMHCGMCTAVCPTKALEVNPRDRTVAFIPERCTACGACTRICPVGAMLADIGGTTSPSPL